MADIYHQASSYLENWLNQKNKFTEILDEVERITGVNKVYIVKGSLFFFALYMIIGHFAELICNLVGFAYPAYASIGAIETSSKDDDTKWLTYWVVFAFFRVSECFIDTLFYVIPFYWLAKVIFLVWCFLPIENNGSLLIYSRFIRPVFLKNHQKIDNVVQIAAEDVAVVAGKVMEGAKKISQHED